MIPTRTAVYRVETASNPNTPKLHATRIRPAIRPPALRIDSQGRTILVREFPEMKEMVITEINEFLFKFGYYLFVSLLELKMIKAQKLAYGKNLLMYFGLNYLALCHFFFWSNERVI